MSKKSQTAIVEPDYTGRESTKKQRTFLAVVIVLLLLSVVILALCLAKYAKADKREVALVTNSDAEVEIFTVEYADANGEVTVKSNNGDKLIAPGTSYSHTIRLRNADEFALDYELEPQFRYSSRHRVPLRVKLYSVDGEYILGSENEWAELEDMRSVTHKGTLGKAQAHEYVFEWQWPYESGDDEKDTLLGNVEKDFGLAVSINLHAVANTSVTANGGLVESGVAKILAISGVAIILIAIIAWLIIYIAKKQRAALEAADEYALKMEAKNKAQKEKQQVESQIAYVSIETLSLNFAPGSVITLAGLKQRGLAPINAKKMHIIASHGSALNKPLILFTQGISPEARSIVMAAGGVVIIIPG